MNYPNHTAVKQQRQGLNPDPGNFPPHALPPTKVLSPSLPELLTPKPLGQRPWCACSSPTSRISTVCHPQGQRLCHFHFSASRPPARGRHYHRHNTLSASSCLLKRPKQPGPTDQSCSQNEDYSPPWIRKHGGITLSISEKQRLGQITRYLITTGFVRFS